MYFFEGVFGSLESGTYNNQYKKPGWNRKIHIGSRTQSETQLKQQTLELKAQLRGSNQKSCRQLTISRCVSRQESSQRAGRNGKPILY